MYTPVNPKPDFPKQEEEVLKFWEKNDIFKKSIRQRDKAEEFVFFDGPPFATGLPHFGHFLIVYYFMSMVTIFLSSPTAVIST